jgi:hypothetical protein
MIADAMPDPMSLFPLLGFRAPSNLRRRKAKEGKGLLERHGDYLIRTERRELALLCTLHGFVFTKIKWCPPPRRRADDTVYRAVIEETSETWRAHCMLATRP